MCATTDFCFNGKGSPPPPPPGPGPPPPPGPPGPPPSPGHGDYGNPFDGPCANGDANTTRKRLLWPPYHEDDDQPAHRGGDGAEEFTLILSEDLEVEVGYLKGACDRLDGLCGKSDCFGP